MLGKKMPYFQKESGLFLLPEISHFAFAFPDDPLCGQLAQTQLLISGCFIKNLRKLISRRILFFFLRLPSKVNCSFVVGLRQGRPIMAAEPWLKRPFTSWWPKSKAGEKRLKGVCPEIHSSK